MVQPNHTDFYAREYNSGCCLKCYDSEPGCLCYECKCKKCYWYIPPGEWDGEKGKCEKTLMLIKEKRRKEGKVVPFPVDLKKRYFEVDKLLIKPENLVFLDMEEKIEDDNRQAS